MKNYTVELNNALITKKGIDATIDFFSTLSTDMLQTHGLYAFMTDINSPFLNFVMDLGPEKENISDIIKSMTHFFDNHQVPWSWLVAQGAKSNNLESHGFSLIETSPAMYFDLSNTLPEPKITEFNIEEADEKSNLMDWNIPITEQFGGDDDDKYRKLNASLFPTKKLRHFVVYQQNHIAGAGTLFLSDNAIMLHNIATRDKFKKRGVATALTLHMMQIAKQLGYQNCFLDASGEAFDLYKKLGFQVYGVSHIYKLAK